MRIILNPLTVMALAFGTILGGCAGPSGVSDTKTDTTAGGTKTADSFGGSTTTGGHDGASSARQGGGAGGGLAASTAQSSGGALSVGGGPTSGGANSSGATASTGGKSTNMGGGASRTATGGTTTSGRTSGGRGPAGGAMNAGGATSIGGGKAGGGSGTIARGGTSGSSSPPNIAGASTTTISGNGCTPPAAYANLFVSLSGHTQAETDAKISKAWSSLFNPSGSGTIYYNGPGSDESYVQDVYSGDVRTEGMSYGMMIAVQLDHQTEFDRLWTWVRNHMASGCSSSGCTGTQIAWSCTTSGSKKSSGGAPDGDEYFAAALVFAHNRWGDTSGKYNYATEAQWVLKLVRTQDFNSTYNLVKFYSGSDNGQTDASYILPAFYQTWACFDTANAEFWNTATTTGRAFFKKAADSSGQFGDQNAYSGGSPANTGVDKIRVVVNIMMDWNFFAADPWQRDTYAPAYGAREKNVGANAEGFCAALLGFGLPASSGKPFVDKLWSASVPSHDYWNGVLYMLAMLHVSGNFHLWY